MIKEAIDLTKDASKIVEGKKRFIIASMAIGSFSFMVCGLMILFMLKKVTFTEINPLLMASIPAIVAIVGGYLGFQTITDNKKIKGGGK